MTTTDAFAALAPTPRIGAATSPPAEQTLSPLLRRISVAALALMTLALYTYDLAASGYANSFYSAAAQAGSQSWEAFFYGSLDSGNSITVDKTPASLWLMALSVRLFGLSSWSILLPQALLGVASAVLLYGTIRRSLTGPVADRSGLVVSPARAHWAAIAGGLAFALTPAATLMFRFNNPDALLVFTYVAAAALTLRAAEAGSRRWIAAAGAMVGLGFLAKMLQAFVILPSLVIAYAVAAPSSWRRKIVDLLVAFGAMVAAFGWWIAIVELVPASMRPYIGGSQANSILELTFGYNGLGRLNGNETGSVGGGGTAGGRWGETGILRMFTTVSGEMVSWLVPAALVLLLVGFLLLGRRSWATTWRSGEESAATRAAGALALFGSWLVLNGLVFSFMAGIYHDYYTVALAPAIAGTVAIGGAIAWSRRDSLLARAGLAVAAFATAAWGVALASVAGGIYLVVSVTAAAVLTLGAVATLAAPKLPKPAQSLLIAVVVAAGLAGPAAYSANTMLTAHTGSIVTAGPARTGIIAGSGMGGGGGAPGRAGQAGTRGQGQFGGQPPQGGQPAQFGGRGQTGTGAAGGGLINGTQVSTELLALLTADQSSYTWVAATTGAQNAAGYQLAGGHAVMAIGGFNGSDPSPTLAQFKAYVAAGQIHYFVGGGNFGGQDSGSRTAGEIASWVAENYTATTVGNVTVYDLTAAK